MSKTKDPAKVAAAKMRADSLPPEKRSQIAAQAAAKRWNKTFTATHKGNFLDDFGIDIECYVLNDPAKTAVISQRGMGEALGLSARGDRFPVFVGSKTMGNYLGRDLRDKIKNPLIFQPLSMAAGSPLPRKGNGYDATVLIDLCKAILDANADGKLRTVRYKRMIEQAQIILGASAKNGIRQLVYALAGYSPTTDEVIAAFKHYVQEEARKYEPEFPNELYLQWQRLYQISVPHRGKPWQFMHLTVRHIYHPLAQSSGKIYSLLKALKAKDGDRQKKLFQFLNEIGARALRIHLGRVLEMAESSETSGEYDRKIAKRFGAQQELDLVVPDVLSNSQKPTEEARPAGT